ncbi:MAG: HAMP domain-containing protein [Spirochaetales bacterium]|nr:HAMP domain-containing protein [Spirochaetales bacterium]
MTIKSRLILLTVIMISALTFSIGVSLFSQRFLDNMLDEERELIFVRELMLEQTIELSKFFNNKIPVISQTKVLEDTQNEINNSIERIKNLKILPYLNEDTEKAFLAIGRLDELLKKSHDQLFTAIKDFNLNFDKNDTTYSIVNIEQYEKRTNYNKIQFDLYKVKSAGSSIEIGLEASIGILVEQSDIIRSVVGSYRGVILLSTLGIVFISVIISFLLTLIISKKISKSIRKMENAVSRMVSGDFTSDIIVESNDELGELAKKMNSFQNDLNNSLNKIKISSSENEEANIGLIETTADSSAVTTEISANIDSINKQMNLLDENIAKTSKETLDISNSTNELGDYISEQMAMVEESTAAITQMIASISNISELTENNTEIIKILERTAFEGDEKLSQTTDLIESINESVNEINNMSEIIKSISDQTNLLAMNAAIEAAHAGDAGKGFAVVADEIRKLAEASASNSMEINKNLNEITEMFNKTAESGQSTREAFANINDKIKSVSNALLVVSSSTSELNTGGSQILEAMESLKDISFSVQEKSDEMKEKAQNVSKISINVSNISETVSGAISEANIGFSGVADSIASLKDVSDRVGSVSKKINFEISKFKTK